ncbi:MAG: Flp pilus assembly protein CpaB [Desulfuromonas sp.]|nr:MAG: Flp pilus assembly protein CpaB [Desulfuromonas sp.]
MKKYGALIALGLAVVFGLLAVWLTREWLIDKQESQVAVVSQQIKTTPVVIAATDIPLGTRLSAENLVMSEWPAKSAPKSAFASIEEVEGRVVVSRMGAGTPVLKAELAEPGSGAGLVALIEPGNRAMAIRVDEVTGVGGFILPNSVVDVISVDAKSQRKKAKTILQKIRVLAIAQATETEEGKPEIVRTVTVQVKPPEAERLALEMHKGILYLVLRNPLDGETPKVAKSKPVKTLRSKVSKKKTVPYDVEVIRGSERDSVKFKDPESEDRY